MPTRLRRQAQAGDAAWAVDAVFERKSAAVTFGNLPAEHQANAGAAWQGRGHRWAADQVTIPAGVGLGSTLPADVAIGGVTSQAGVTLATR